MNKNTLLFVYMSLLVILPQCVLSSRKKKQQAIKIYKHVRGFRRHIIIKADEYAAKIDGVECPFCAESAVSLAKKIDGVVEASYHQGFEGYEDGMLIFAWDIKKGDFPRLKLEKILQEEEFSVNTLDRINEKSI